MALEDWLNDGMAVSAAVARECLIGWYGENTPARGEWKIAGEAVLPQKFQQPALCLIPAGDRIVPPKSPLALADALMRRFGHDLAAIELVPWLEGTFEVSVDGTLVHSMARDGGFPEHATVIDAVNASLAASAAT